MSIKILYLIPLHIFKGVTATVKCHFTMHWKLYYWPLFKLMGKSFGC